jgi:hypothetical protein
MHNKRLAGDAMNEYPLESAFAQHLIDPARPEGAGGPCCRAGVSRQIGDRLVQCWILLLLLIAVWLFPVKCLSPRAVLICDHIRS